MAMHAKHHDPRTWVEVRNGKPLMKAIPNAHLAWERSRCGSLRTLANYLDESGCNVSYVSLSMWIKGTMRMDNERVFMLADALHISPLDLLGVPVSRLMLTGMHEDLTGALVALGRWYSEGIRPTAELCNGFYWLKSALPAQPLEALECPDAMADILRSIAGDWRDPDALARDALDYYLNMEAGFSQDMITPIVITGRNSAEYYDNRLKGRFRDATP